MTIDEAKQLQPGDRLTFDLADPSDDEYQCEVFEVNPHAIRIRWPTGGGMSVWFSDTRLLSRFSRTGIAAGRVGP